MSQQLQEQMPAPDQQPDGQEFSQFPWLPFPMRELQEERRTVIASHEALPGMIDAIKAAEAERLDAIRADADANIEAVKRAAEQFIADTLAAVRSEEDRSNMELAAYDDKFTQTTDLVTSYDTTGRQLITELTEFENLINERSDLDATVAEKEALLEEKQANQASKVEESIEAEARLQLANQDAELARNEGRDRTYQGGPREWVPDIHDGENVRKRVIDKAVNLDAKKQGIVSEIGQLYVEIHELTTQLSIANSQTYPTLLEKLEVKEAEALAHRAELARISFEVAACVDAIRSKTVKAAPAIADNEAVQDDTEIIARTISDKNTQPAVAGVEPEKRVPSHRDVPSSPISFMPIPRSLRGLLVGGRTVQITDLKGN